MLVEDLIFLENNIVWFLNSVELYNILSYSRFFFLTTFYTNFRKRVHNLKETVNIQGFDRWLRRYDHISTNTKYYHIIERVYFIYRLLILFISTLSLLLF